MPRSQTSFAAGAAMMAAACSPGPSAEEAEAAHPPIGAFVEVEGLRVHYVDQGAGPTVILIHGASGNLRDFTFSLLPKLAVDHRVIAFDRPGHGYTGRPADGADPAAQARILEAAARAIGVERAVLVGHSYGAAPALAWALAAPDMATGLASISGASHPWDGSLSPAYRWSANSWTSWLLRSLAAGRMEALVDEIFAPNPAPPGYYDAVGAALALRPGTFRWNAEDVLALNAHLARQAPRYGELTIPVEIVQGAADGIVLPEISPEGLARDAPNARLTLLPGIGHMPHHAAEDETIAAIRRLTGQPAS